jgi:acyl transferase domain-containing protein/NAD(P)-dependent dehydrogenase (short-subunit alcohol dehydrogenase family)
VSKHPPLAIVGIGCLLPKAATLTEYWANLVSNRVAIGDIPADHSWSPADYFDPDPQTKDKTWCTRGGFLDPVPFDPVAHGVLPNLLESIDTTQLLSLLVAREALRDAGFDPDGDHWDRARTSCILGVTGTQEMAINAGARLQGPIWRKALRRAGLDEAMVDTIVQDIANHFPTWTEQTFPGLLGNVVAGRIANRLDLGGTNAVVDAACASSLAAVQYAASELSSGRSDLVLTGGADTLNDAFMYQCFTRTPAFSRNNDARPFDASSDGILIGEGVVLLAMMRLDDARAQGRRIYASLRGLGSSSDGRYKSIYAPNPSGQVIALRRAYASAEIRPRTVELVEAHGTGTRAGDAAEVQALTEVYRADAPDGRWVTLGTVKSQIGHTKSTAGAAGLAKAALALYQRVLPPTARIERPNPKMDFDRSPFYLSPRARPWVRAADHPRRAAVSAFGFGGSNFHAVLEEEPTEPVVFGPAPTSLFLFGGSRDAVDQALQALASSDGPVDHRSAEVLADWRPGGETVVAFVAEDAAALQARAARARAALRGEATGDDVYLGGGAPSGQVAFLFPGQGSQYVEMARTVAIRHPRVRRALDHADEAFRVAGRQPLSARIYPPPAWDEAERRSQEDALTATEWAQPAIGAVSKGLLDALTAFGVRADTVAGHSYGELVALHAAGVLDEADFWTASRVRGESMAANGRDRGTMAAVSGRLDAIAQVLVDHPEVVLANRNHPEQGVLSGTRAGVARACEALQAAGFTTRDIAVSAAFHSPLVADAQAPFAEALAGLSFQSPQLPVWSNTTARPYPNDADAARALLARQIVEPVDFCGILEGMLADGVRTFIEVGPRGVLSGLVRKCAGPGRRDITVVALDRQGSTVDGDTQLKVALAQLAAAGLPIDPAPLLAERRSDPGLRPQSAATVWIAGANVRNPSTREPPMPHYPKPSPPPAPPMTDGWGAVPHSGAPVAPPPPLVRSDLAPATPPSAAAAPAGDIAALVASTRDALAAFQATQERTAQVHAQFLDAFAKANETFAVLFQAHAQLLAQSGTGASIALAPAIAPLALPSTAPPRPAPAASVAAPPESPPAVANPNGLLTALPGDTGRVTVKTATTRTSDALPPLFDAKAAIEGRAGPAPAAVTAKPAAQAVDWVAAVFDAVAAKTGYPKHLLELGMDLEADLGIDSIKRVEILSAVQERVPGLPDLDNDRMASLRTLAEVVAAVSGGGAPAAAPRAAGLERDGVVAALFDAVASKTGYPRTLLEPAMDLEADLGIDSIKRVEILSAVQERIPGLPTLETDRLAALRTLTEVVDALLAAVGGAPAPTLVTSPGQLGPPRIARDALVAGMLDAVAEKTGYPRALLELGMDLEADLGIDSIKRVEILSAVQGRVPGLPDIDTETLSSLRTLADVVEALGQDRPDALASPVLVRPRSNGLIDAAALLGVPADDTSGLVGAPAVLRPPVAPATPAASDPGLPPVTTARELLASVDPIPALLRREVVLAPAAQGRPAGWTGEAVLLASDHPLADAVADALRTRGVAVRVERPDWDDTDAVARAAAGAHHVVHLAALGGAAATLRSRVIGAFVAARARAAEPPASFTVISDLGGGFGLDRVPRAPITAALAGIAKTIAIEWPDTRARALDLDPDALNPQAIADALLWDWGVVEVGLGPTPQTPVERQALVPAGEAPLRPGELAVITGGARGVTAAVARELARRWRPALLLLGRSDPPTADPAWAAGATDDELQGRFLADCTARGERPTPKQLQTAVADVRAAREIRATLDALTAAGATPLYRSVDARDPEAVARAVRDAEATHGPTRVWIHGAGVLADKRIADKTDAQFASVFSTKWDGLAAGLSALDPHALRVCAVFSSIAGRRGNRGQVDYAAANEAIGRLARAAVGPNTRVKVLDWGPWDGGMVTPELKRQFGRLGHGLVGLRSGAAACADELCAPGHAEVLLEGSQPDVGTRGWHLVGDEGWLVDHALGGVGVVPVAMVVDQFAALAAACAPDRTVRAVEALSVLKGVRVTEPMALTLAWSRDGDAVACELRSEDGRVTHYRASVLLGAPGLQAPPATHPLAGAPGWTPSVAETYRTHLFHGPRWRRISAIQQRSTQGIVGVVQPTRPADLDVAAGDWALDPGVIDAVLQLLVIWVREETGAAALPTGLEVLERYGPWEGPLTVQIEADRSAPGAGHFDAELVDAHGRLVGRIRRGSWAASTRLNAQFEQAAR